MRSFFFLYLQFAFQKKVLSDTFCAWKFYLVITLLEKKYLYRFKFKKILWFKTINFFLDLIITKLLLLQRTLKQPKYVKFSVGSYER